MKKLYFSLTICILSFCSLDSYAKKDPSSGSLVRYEATTKLAIIGVTEDRPVDNPADNLFHVQIGTALTGRQKAWLVYELEGVEDHTSVSRSINDQLAVGGYLVKRRRGWAVQRELINIQWLKSGDNVIRFTMPEGAEHMYKIRNLQIEIETPETNEPATKIHVNQASGIYFYDKAYVKGVIIGDGAKGVQLSIGGVPVKNNNGEFEIIVGSKELAESCSLRLEALHPDGSVSHHTVTFTEPVSADFVFSYDNAVWKSEKHVAQHAIGTVELHGTFLRISEKALKESTLLSITSLRSVDIPALDAGMVNVTKNHAGFRFLPHGTLFATEVGVTIPYDVEKIPDGYTAEDIRTYYFDEASHHWVVLKRDTLLEESGLIKSNTLHFTDMINGIIKVPESPEVQAYNSTSIKGIKAANPTAGINLINPPQANNSGSANISYPINIPPGRMAMQPQLAVSYNSGGGNGWMGLGWNLNIPAISIETRWGVPRYDTLYETETYVLNGEQLSPVAHRGELQNRYPDGKQFYPRVEGAFNKIVRHGDDPTDYWWEVIDKSGTRYFYGAEGTKVADPSSVLTDNENNKPNKRRNIAYWALRETRDLNGNTVKYYYDKVPDKGLSQGKVDGWQIYISKITYTGENGGDGPFEVLFTRTNTREDKIISGNLGFKQVTGDLLTRIDVKYNNIIRYYEFTYATGEFRKTLLSRITEFDSKGNEFTHHEFSYYNDVLKNGFTPAEGNDTWNVPPDYIKGGFVTDIGGFKDEATALSGTKSKDLNLGLTVSVGVGFNVFAKAASAGVSGGYSKSTSEGLLTMLDMNGDGLQDKVINKDGLFYRPNLLAQTGNEEFGDKKKITGINGFFLEKSKTTSIGAEASFGVFVGYSHSRTTGKTTTYVTDVNGDQLPDIVQNGKVYFNHLDRASGDVTYKPESEGTPNVIYAGKSITGDIIDQQALENERQLALQQNPLLDIVRMWRAPYDGDIKITAPVKLLQSTNPERNETPRDGVRVAVQLRDTELWMQEIEADDTNEYLTQPLNAVHVKRGDFLYFRVGSIDNGFYDSISWNPVIEYLNKPSNSKDANRKYLYRFEAEEDYLLSSEQWVTPPFNGKVLFTGALNKPRTTDDVQLLILKAPLEGEETDTVWMHEYKWNEEAYSFPDTSIDVTNTERYLFKVITKTNIDWTSFSWRPHLIYESTDAEGINLERNPVEVYPVPELSLFVNTLHVAPVFKVELDSAGQEAVLDFKPDLDFDLSPFKHYSELNGEITFSIKKTDTLLAKKTLIIENGVIKDTTALSVTVTHDDSLFIEYHTLNHRLVLNLTSAKAIVTAEEENAASADVGIYTVIPHKKDDKNDNREDIIYGTLYRGWGHFGWNGNNGWENEVIVRDQLKISDEAKNQEEVNTDNMTGEDLESSGAAYDAKKDRFFPLIPSGGDWRWTSGDQYAYVLPAIMSSSRFGDDDLSIIKIDQGTIEVNTGAAAIDRVSKSKGNAFTYGVSLGLSAAQSKSSADSYSMTDFMDMNGDRYPDIVTEKIIQYTNALGGLSDKVIPSKGEVQKTHATTDGYTVSGSFPMTMPKFRDGIKKTEKKTESGDAASTSGSVSLNIGKTTGDNEADYSWLDINGDGLPDRVNLSGGTAALNVGYGFEDEEPWGFGYIQQGGSKTETGGAGLGFNFGQNSISAGFSLARSDNFSNEMLADINGDGLVDKIQKGTPLQVSLNTGNGFAAPVNWKGASSISESATASESANLAFTVGFSFLGVKWTVTPTVSGGHAMSRETMKIMDMNGDGYPDFVTSSADNDLHVTPSIIGRTNLLKEVTRPLGASFTMSYKQLGNTYEMPNNQWVLDTVKVFDGFEDDGVDKMMTSYAYEDGIYDRREREFFGFSKVITKTHNTGESGNPVYTQVAQTFNNDNYYKKGLLLSEVMTDGAGNKYVEKINEYEFRNILNGTKLTEDELDNDSGNAFPALLVTEQKFYEGQSSPGKTTKTKFEYDVHGNVVNFIDEGDEGEEDDLSAAIAYHKIEDLYLIGSPSSVTVTSNGTVYRKREADIDVNTGNVTQIRQYLSDSEIALHDMEYDRYGNLKKITRPQNAKGQRLAVEYEYDTEVNIYTTKATNSYGYSSEATYDVGYGQILTSTDLNGHVISYELDDVGRIKSVVGPYEKGGGKKTIEFEYAPFATVPYALTKHLDPAMPNNPLLTATFVDGLGRVLQTKKDAALFDGEGKPDKEVMIVSGRVIFDGLGRTVKAYYPTTQTSGDPGDFKDVEDGILPTITEYDVMNRTVKVTLPDNAVATTTYGFDTDRNGKNQFSTKTTDANGKQTQQFTDVRGRVTSVKNITSEQPVWTSFVYNAIGEQTEAIDDLGYTTFSAYDNLGRRIERKHPDAGTTTYNYDLAGNLTELVTANLAKEGLAILYDYDFERLAEITYPQNSENNVKYTYGEAGADYNRAGRIVLQEDASGAQEFFYGPLGEVVKNVRTVIIPQHDEQTYVTEWEYDTWNRLVSMTYADGEKVTYKYNAGGLLHSMSGKKKNSSYNYVNQLGYDKFEQRIFLEYGNGTKTTYAYEEDRRRLKNMTASTSAKRLFMDNAYTYDKVNNILSLKNSAPIPSSNLMGGMSEYTYEYDDLYRLSKAEGSYKSSNDEHVYTLSMSYNSVGGITQKTQNHHRKGTVQKKTSYDLTYTYSTEQPHAPVHIGEQTYSYDANGNQTGWTDDKTGQRRRILWDEENRIRSIYDNGAQHHYIYDAAGERVLKGKSTGQRIFVNGEWKAGSGQMGNYTVYVNPYLVLKSGGYTKHYYIEGQRIVSKLGGGWDNNGKGPLKAGEGKVDYIGRGQKVFDGIVKNLKFLGADGQILTAGKSGKVPPGQVKGSGNITEKFRYFYHPDHLGSTSYVTDASGEVFQHLEYTAWGETFVEEHSNTDRTPYLFNSKELDEETGLYYYGARYYDARTSVFTSIDPMTDKFPSFSPYVYAFNSPLRFIDPSGMQGEEPTTYKVQKGNTLSQIAKEKNTTVDAIMKVNPSIKNADKIKEGQTINLPGTPASEDNSGQSNAPAAQNNPLMRHSEQAVSWTKWVEENKGLTRDQIINQRPSRQGMPGGPELRYVFDPLDPNAVIDMRHMLVVGKSTPFVGNAVEIGQLILPSTRPSSMDPQDFYSNQLGYRFYRYADGKGLTGWLINNVISSETEFTNRLNSFLNNPVYRGNKIFIDR